MHLAIPPAPVRNPGKGFKKQPKRTRTEKVSTDDEPVQTSSGDSLKKSFRKSMINTFASRTRT
ncbi:hypothetical protein N7530_004739 [Penicillium desertorum]|uniref:Uncharacterized protein n=1 Tax=Penicillium desertorum TaxID=1303715 RepID=A0A9W9WZ57_9EURO|nr:hypothetical protein N7530_004739 [Penicillium desertorum]